MQVLTLTRNPADNTIIAARIDDLQIENMHSIIQNLQSGSLQATISASFDKILVEDGTVGPQPAPALAVTFQPGSSVDTTVAVVSEGLPGGTSFKYALANAHIPVPMIGADAAALFTTLVDLTPGADLMATPGTVIAAMIVDTNGGIVKLTQHTLTVSEVNTQ